MRHVDATTIFGILYGSATMRWQELLDVVAHVVVGGISSSPLIVNRHIISIDQEAEGFGEHNKRLDFAM